jgi:poly(3-hydroxybutyrate) depolymerase
MSKIFAFLIGTVAISSAAPLVRYLDNVFANYTLTSNVVYGANTNNKGTHIILTMDIYQPAGDTVTARPLVIFLFGGGWAVGSKNDGDVSLISQTFAKKGYVAASINYRLDTALMDTKPLPLITIANFQGMQDAKAAVRFLRSHKTTYKIDDTKIMMGGFSAGAFISLEVGFLDQKEIPAGIDTTKIGGLEGNSGTPGVSSAINGVFNGWGAILDSTWLYNNKIPVICIAGAADPSVPPDHNATWSGSACINRVLTRLNVYSVLKLFPNVGHGIVTGDPRFDTLLTLDGQFAYDVLFKNSPTSTVQSAKAAPQTHGPSPAQPNVFYQGYSSVTGPLFRLGTTYGLDGSLIAHGQNNAPLHKAAGVYVFRP